MKKEEPKIRVSRLLIQELCDGDKNSPFRHIIPIFMIEQWSKHADDPV